MGPNYSISTACATSNFCILSAANHIIRGEAVSCQSSVSVLILVRNPCGLWNGLGNQKGLNTGNLDLGIDLKYARFERADFRTGINVNLLCRMSCCRVDLTQLLFQLVSFGMLRYYSSPTLALYTS